MKTLNVMVVTSLLAFGACSAAPEPAVTSVEGASGSSGASSSAGTPTVASTDGAISGRFSVGARQLRLDCVGTGSPTLVLEGGDGVPSAEMADVVEREFSQRVRVCSYDRANTGASDQGAPLPRRTPEVVSDLHELLASGRVPGPYVLVGHSAGGMLVQAYAKSHPADVVGVVSMNPVPPWDQWAERAFPAMTPPERTEETAYFAGKGSPETFDYRQISQQTASMPAPPDVPFHLLVASIDQCDTPDDICGRTYPAYLEITEALSKDWPQGRFTQAGSGHELYLTNPEAVVTVIEDVLSR